MGQYSNVLYWRWRSENLEGKWERDKENPRPTKHVASYGLLCSFALPALELYPEEDIVSCIHRNQLHQPKGLHWLLREIVILWFITHSNRCSRRSSYGSSHRSNLFRRVSLEPRPIVQIARTAAGRHKCRTRIGRLSKLLWAVCAKQCSVFREGKASRSEEFRQNVSCEGGDVAELAGCREAVLCGEIRCSPGP